MQKKNQWKRNWKVVAGVGTAAALGFAGIAFAGPGNASGVPDPITLQRQVVTGESPMPSPSTTLRVTLTTDKSPSLSPSTASQATVTTARIALSKRHVARHVTTGKAPSPSPTTASQATVATGHDDTDCSLDDCSSDSPDLASDDSSPDSPDLASDDASDSIDSADSSIDS